MLANLTNHQRFGKLKRCKLVFTINNLLVDQFIHQTFPQNAYPSIFAKNLCLKISRHMVHCTGLYKTQCKSVQQQVSNLDILKHGKIMYISCEYQWE